jgi:hypothetical protein
MRRGTVIVKGQTTDGSVGDIDVLDLEEDSFRLWLIDTLLKTNLIPSTHGGTLDLAAAEAPVYRQRLPIGHPRGKPRATDGPAAQQPP